MSKVKPTKKDLDEAKNLVLEYDIDFLVQTTPKKNTTKQGHKSLYLRVAELVAETREECAKVAETEWLNGKGAGNRAVELASGLCRRIATAIRKGE